MKKNKKELNIRILEELSPLDLLKYLKEENFLNKEILKDNGKIKGLSYVVKLNHIKTRDVRKINYSFKISFEKSKFIYEISWVLENKELEPLIDNFRKIVKNVIQRLDEIEKESNWERILPF